ncbi:hypothetical protein K0M31_017900 [Melipona bicolor]|uniref:Neurotrimin n=1 Tax=Melipona bicolor TaxID=60889 RepID=A0AA40KSV0_9HYME|nr:hypothetical protein K0M31_017900 [Melipona bicolor]
MSKEVLVRPRPTVSMRSRFLHSYSLILMAIKRTSAWCKPSKNSEGADYIDDESDYNDDTVDDEDPPDDVEPQIISKSDSIRVRNGTTVYLHCLLKNADRFTVTWKKDNEYIYYDSNAMKPDNQRIVRLPNNTLVIYNATINDTSDDYECSILNKPPITIKHRVMVVSEPYPASPALPPTEQYKPSLIRVIPARKVEVNAGENVTLGCETKTQWTPEIKWYHENERVHSNVIISGNYITITNIKKHDGGRYQCLAENGMENPPVEAITVNVNYAPEIDGKGKWVHTGLGVESRLICNVHAHPRGKVTWFKDQEEVLPKKGSIEIKANKTRHILEILHTEKEHLGNYTCVAENKLGQTEKIISLTGIPTQAIISGGEMTKTASGLILKWQLESYSPITEYKLQYRRKGDKDWRVVNPTVTNGRGYQFTVEYTVPVGEPGSYEAVLMARNNFGWSEPSDPHEFIGVKGSASQPVLAIATLFLVVSSCAFTSL